MTTVPIIADKEWQVISPKNDHWRTGIYRPKYRSVAEIPELEQHTCPESFLLLQGTLIMVFKNADGSLSEKKLAPMELTTFTEPHAGFSPELDGVAFVVENARFETTYTDIKTGAVTRRVRVD
jgi:hypothetical protein